MFSEPLEAAYSALDVVDANGHVVHSRLGAPDRRDRRVLVAPLADLPSGTYTIRWRALSAADGHATSGVLTFAVGTELAPVAVASSADGHGTAQGHAVATETQSRAAIDLGFMFAFGWAVIGIAVFRSTLRPNGLVLAQAVALGVALVGALALAALAFSEVSGGAFSYFIETRTGLLLAARVGVAAVGTAVVAFLLRTGRVRLGLRAGGLAGAIGILLVSLSGHAAAFASPAVVASVAVHVAAAGIWLAGLLALTRLAPFGGAPTRPLLGTLVPRFSAVALVAGVLFVLGGLYAGWAQTRTLFDPSTQYGTVLALKVAIVAMALALGALNLLDRGKGRPWLGGLPRRIGLESALAVVAVVLSAALAALSAPAQERPVTIAPAASTAATDTEISLQVGPGRPGPNRYLVTMRDPPAVGTSVALSLQRLDATNEVSRVELGQPGIGHESTPAMEAPWIAEGGLLPPESRWDATVVVNDAGGRELERQRFEFALDGEQVSEGRAAPPIDPALALGIALVALAVLAGSYVFAGGTVPFVEQSGARRSVLTGAAVAASLGVVMIATGQHL